MIDLSVPVRIILYARTVKYLRFDQICNRLWRAIYRPSIPSGTALILRPKLKPIVPGPRRPPSVVSPSDVRFLCETANISSATSWNSFRFTKLWLYQLHYFDDLCAIDADRRLIWHRELIRRWIDENPVGQGIGWDPYPLSLRIANWAKWHLTCGGLDEVALLSLCQQVRYLWPRLEYHLRGNHLLENFRALTIAGCLFSGTEAERWRVRGLQGLEEEVENQILADGGHVERAPMYQGIVLASLLDVVNVLRCYDVSTPPWLAAVCQRMSTWSLAMEHSDGDWVQFNDTSLGYAARPANLIEYQSRLGVAIGTPPPSVVHLAESGYLRAQRADWILFADGGDLGPDYNPAHGHADTLTYELALRGRRFVVDTGISTYEICSARDTERSTAAHNTVEIDGENSSEVWASFRVARRARARWLGHTSTQGIIKFAAEHDGYCRLRGSPTHRREWRVTDDAIEIVDEIQSTAAHRLRARIHLHPDYEVDIDSNRTVSIRLRDADVIAHVTRGTWSDVSVESYLYAPEFGRQIEGRCIVLNHLSSGEISLSHAIHAVSRQ